MGPARIYPWRKMRRSRAPSIAPGRFFVAQSWADCITNMAGFTTGTISYFALRMPKIEAWRLAANSQRPAIGGLFCEYHGHFLRASDCLAGDAVLIAPVSKQIPC